MRAAIHFLILGALLFATSRQLGGEDPATMAQHRIVIDASRMEGIRRAYSVGMGAPPTVEEMAELVEKTIEEEVLFREALARGLEHSDRAIGWRLVQKMRYLGEAGDDGEHAGHGRSTAGVAADANLGGPDGPEKHGKGDARGQSAEKRQVAGNDNGSVTRLYQRALELGLHREDPVVRRILVQKMRLLVGHLSEKPTEAELVAYYEQHRDRFAQPQRVSMQHVYFDSSRRGADDARVRAEAAAVAAENGEAFERGDPFVMGSRLAAQSEQDLAKLFGVEFARSVFSSADGSQWQGPLRSSYGWHLVQIQERRDVRIPELAAVRTQIERALAAERSRRRVQEFLAAARRAYRVEVETAGSAGGGGDA